MVGATEISGSLIFAGDFSLKGLSVIFFTILLEFPWSRLEKFLSMGWNHAIPVGPS